MKEHCCTFISWSGSDQGFDRSQRFHESSAAFYNTSLRCLASVVFFIFVLVVYSLAWAVSGERTRDEDRVRVGPACTPDNVTQAGKPASGVEALEPWLTRSCGFGLVWVSWVGGASGLGLVCDPVVSVFSVVLVAWLEVVLLVAGSGSTWGFGSSFQLSETLASFHSFLLRGP